MDRQRTIDLRTGGAAAESGTGGPRTAEDTRRDAFLVGLTIASGATDAVSFLGLGGVFTANMTGNVVLLGLAVASRSLGQAFTSSLALAAFAFGVYAGSRICGARQTGRWSRSVTATLSLETVLLTAFWVVWLAIDGHPAVASRYGLALLAATAMGVQSAAARALAVPGISTTYVTGTLTGLMGDLGARGRRAHAVREIAIVGSLVAGAVAGALVLRLAPLAAPAVPLALVSIVTGSAVAAFGPSDGTDEAADAA